MANSITFNVVSFSLEHKNVGLFACSAPSIFQRSKLAFYKVRYMLIPVERRTPVCPKGLFCVPLGLKGRESPGEDYSWWPKQYVPRITDFSPKQSKKDYSGDLGFIIFSIMC